MIVVAGNLACGAGECPEHDAPLGCAVVRDLEATVGTCGERIWPGADWNGFRVTVVDAAEEGSGGIAVSWSPGRPVRSRAWEGGRPGGCFSIDRRDGVAETVVFAPCPGRGVTAEGLYRLALHEGFHAHVQRRWSGQVFGERSPRFPLQWRPRHLRHEIASALLDAVEGGRGLGAAAHWLDRWRADHGEKAQDVHGTDVSEGSAAFAETRGVLLARAGCAADLASLQTEEAARWESSLPGAAPEPYVLGVLAGAAAGERCLTDWSRAVETGTTPAEAAVVDVRPEPAPEDPDLVERARAWAGRENERLAGPLDAIAERWTRPAWLWLVVPWAWLQGSFRMAGDYRLSAVEGEPLVFLDFQAVVGSPRQGDVEIAADVVVLTDDVCGQGPAFALPIGEELESQQDGERTVRLRDRTLLVAAPPDAEPRWRCLL